MNAVSGQSSPWRMRLWGMLAIFALLVMETAAYSLWYQALFLNNALPWGDIFAVLGGFLLGSYLLARVVAAARWRLIIRQAVFFAWILAAMYGSLKLLLFPSTGISLIDLVELPVLFIFRVDVGAAAFFHLVCIILLAWRGVSLARSPLTLNLVQFSFQLGLVTILLYGMFYSFLYPIQATIGLYTYLFFGLIAMSMTRINSLSENRGGRIPRFGLNWLASILFAGLVVVGLAILIGLLAQEWVLDALATVFLIFFAILTALTLLLLSPLLLVLAQIAPRLADLIAQLLNRLKEIGLNQQLEKLLQVMNAGLIKIIPFVLAGRGLILAGGLVLLVLCVLLALQLRKLRIQLIQEEESEPVETVNAGSLLRKLLRRLLWDARNLRARSPAQVLAAARIRQIYQQLMLLSQKLGAPRPASLTPLEFLPRLEDLFPAEADGLRLITGAYMSVRYGEYPETRQEVDRVQAAWNQVRSRGRALMALNRKTKGQSS